MERVGSSSDQGELFTHKTNFISGKTKLFSSKCLEYGRRAGNLN